MIAEKKKVASFNTVWIRYDKSSSDRHQLFIKEHSIRNQEPEYPKGKTLFVLNIPPYATSKSLSNAFSKSFGPVKSVTFIQSDKGFKNGYIVFIKESTVKKVLLLSQDHTLILNTKDAPVLSGIEKWCKDYNEAIKNESEIKQSIEKYINEYDLKVAERLELEKATEDAVDNDGWTTVTARKKRGQFALARKESTIQKVQLKEENKKHKKQLLNFYTFQIREAKKQNLAELRKKFELDKKKLEQIKSKRKFKPF